MELLYILGALVAGSVGLTVVLTCLVWGGIVGVANLTTPEERSRGLGGFFAVANGSFGALELWAFVTEIERWVATGQLHFVLFVVVPLVTLAVSCLNLVASFRRGPGYSSAS